jgi:hypothetical protein
MEHHHQRGPINFVRRLLNTGRAYWYWVRVHIGECEPFDRSSCKNRTRTNIGYSFIHIDWNKIKKISLEFVVQY